MDNKRDLAELMKLLEKELEVYEALLEIAKNKQQAVVEGEVDNLRNLIMKEKAMVKMCEKAAHSRTLFINEYCKKRNIKALDIPLKDFIGFSQEPEKKKLENLRYQLKNILNEIKSVNRQNETLLHFSLNHIKKMTNIFLHSSSEEMNMYNFNGKKYNKELGQKFVNRQI